MQMSIRTVVMTMLKKNYKVIDPLIILNLENNMEYICIKRLYYYCYL